MTTVEECRSLLRVAFPALPVATVRYLASGWDSTAFVVGENYVFRFPMRAEVDATLQVEARLLPELAPRLPLPVPRFDYLGRPTPAFPWHFAGYRLLPGVPLADVDAGAVPAEALAAALGPFLAALHRFPVERAAEIGVPAFTPDTWLGRYRQLFERARAVVERRLAPALVSRFVSDWESYLDDPSNWRFVPTLVHGDLSGDHVLAERQQASGWRVSGVIDFGDVMVGDRALDYAGFDRRAARQIAAASGADADPLLWRRVARYQRAGPLHAIDAGAQLGRADLVEMGLLGLRAQLASVRG